MKKTYKYKNGIIHVTLPESCDREKLRKITEDFLKKVISGGSKYGDSDSSKNFREK